MNVLGDRLRGLRKERGLNQDEFSKDLNKQFGLKTDRVMISKWETGFQTPIMSTIICIAKYFGVSIDYLNGNDDLKQIYPKFPSPNITEDYTTFPVIGDIAAGYEHIAMESWEGENVDIPNSYLRGYARSDFFVLRVIGDSMYPLYMDGDKVLILKQSTLNHSGDIGAIIYDGECATLKKVEYVMGEDWMKLIPINPNYPPKTIEGVDLETCKVLGIPKLVIREID